MEISALITYLNCTSFAPNKNVYCHIFGRIMGIGDANNCCHISGLYLTVGSAHDHGGRDTTAILMRTSHYLLRQNYKTFNGQ